MKLLLAAGLILALIAGCVPREVREGEELYLRHCASCHGTGAWGTALGPPLHSESRRQILQQVRQPRDKMPPFPPEALPEKELKKIADYLVWLHQAGHPH